MASVRPAPRVATTPSSTSTASSTTGTAPTSSTLPAGTPGWKPSVVITGVNAKAAKVVAADPALQALVNQAKPAFAGKKVLMIGDSHTVGLFGERFDTLLRAAGAKTRSYGQAGSKPSWWVSGQPGAMGNAIRESDRFLGDGLPWNTSRPTPKAADLLGAEKPDVLIIAHGANFRGLSAAGIEAQVKAMADQAKALGITLVWVGPPNTAKDVQDPKAMTAFNAALGKAVAAGQGSYIASSPFTPNYSGSDGLHFNGTKGREIAFAWADGVFAETAKRLTQR